jgi:hypothetical protein
MSTFHIAIIAAIFYASLTQSAAAAAEPSRPQSPKSQAECMAWGKSYQSYWDDVIAKARQRDEKCKSTFKGSYTSVRSWCANTTGQADHQNPCDDATMWTGCEWIGYFRGMGACLSALAQNQKSAAPAKGTIDQKAEQLIELDADDVSFLKTIAKQDQFIRDLAKAGAGVGAIGDVLELAAEGQAELLVKWNQGLIAEWRVANERLDILNKHATCGAIVEHSLNTKAIYYFDQLYAARGCDKY